MTCPCPTCGAPLAEETFSFDADVGIVVGNGHAAALTPHEAEIFERLLDAKGRLMTRAALMDVIYGLKPDDEPDQKIIDVYVHKLRAKLKPLGGKIETHWGRGWRLIIGGAAMETRT